MMSKFPGQFLAAWLPLAIVFTFTLQACGDNSQPNLKPLATPTRSTNSTPTSVVPDQATLNSYTHSTNRFSINYPERWGLFERPDGVIFIEPGDQAGYSVVFSDAGRLYNQEELNQYLVTFVAQNFAGEGSNFKAISQEQVANGSVVARFTSIDSNLEQATSEMRVLQKDTIVFVVHLSATEEQWETWHNGLQKLADSFTPLDTTSVVETQPTSEAPTWTLIGPASKEFAFLYADDWEIVEQGKNSVSVRLPNANMTFTATKFAWPEAKNDPTATEKAALAHIENLSEAYDNVQNLPPAEFPLDTATGATIDFLYTDGDTDMAGSVITAVSGGKMHKIVFTAPAGFYDAALQWFNPMYKSFKFLEPEELIEEEP